VSSHGSSPPRSSLPLTKADFSLLADWFGRPHVAPWWREPADLPRIEAAYGPLVDGSDPTEGFIAAEGGRLIGFIQRYRLDDNPEWRAAVAVGLGDLAGLGLELDPWSGRGAGIDYLIGDETTTGRGVGRRMIATFVDLTWARYPEISAVVVAVQQDNMASWKALEGAGFCRVWGGRLASDDPSDQGPSYLYLKPRPEGP
jgi:aminoglycoside 6'-N-acetyltransferase